MTSKLTNKLKLLPKEPGVYFHKNNRQEIIYVGKAANLRNRVKQYFQASRVRDPKTDLLVEEISDVDWTVVSSEAEALFLEAELIRRYQPKYNILLRDDKSLSFVRINSKDYAPSVSLTRRPLDDNADYYGPFLSALPVKRSLKYLRKAFPFSIHVNKLPPRACLQVHLGLCPGPETSSYDQKTYKKNLKKLSQYLSGKTQKVADDLEKEMLAAANKQNFEKAARIRNQLNALKALQVQIIFGDKENLDLSKDHALYELTQVFGLKHVPRRIEGYDISHMSGTDTVASMVVFSNGISNKSAYRKFKMNIPGNDDFAHMNEVIKRRLSEKNIKAWGKADFILIDGGKGQLAAAIQARDELGYTTPMIGLAKKYEDLVVSKSGSNVNINLDFVRKLEGILYDDSEKFVRISLPHNRNIIKLFQRIRDESHRFAVSYHSVLKSSRQTKSFLDTIPGIGPSTKKKLLTKFGSKKAILDASAEELIPIIGKSKTQSLHRYKKVV
jgi:excinuclease ABC subunit C